MLSQKLLHSYLLRSILYQFDITDFITIKTIRGFVELLFNGIFHSMTSATCDFISYYAVFMPTLE